MDEPVEVRVVRGQQLAEAVREDLELFGVAELEEREHAVTFSSLPGGTAGTDRFLQRVQKFLTSKGKITGAWEEAAHGGGIDKAQRSGAARARNQQEQRPGGHQVRRRCPGARSR